MTIKCGVAALMLSIVLGAGCVTQTERVPYRPYGPPEDEGVMAELRREFGWQKPPNGSSEPFYKRAARTVSGWFHKEDTPASTQELQEARRQFEQEQREAFRRLHEQQEHEQQGLKNKD